MTTRKTDVWNQILGLSAHKEGQLFSCGTAFLIGKQLAMTATHVLDQPFDRRHFDQDAPGADEFGVVASQIIERREHPLLWRVKEMGRYPSLSERDDRPFDIGLLALEPFSPVEPGIEYHRNWFFELNVATPKIGMRVVAYGFTKPRWDRDPDDADTFNLQCKFRRIEGTVVDVHFPKRDDAGMPFPCFQVDADFEPGMSGGPIFNDRQQVCGVISRGSGFGASWGSILWPALAIHINGKTGLELAHNGEIRARNFHCVKLHQVPGEKFPDVSFDPTTEIL